MNAKFLLLAVGIAGLTSCATSYKTGQTPDDVYFSPAPKYVEKEVVKEEENRQDNYYDYRDRAARMKTTNYRRWNSLDDPYYFDSYSYSPSYNYKYNYSYGYSYNYNPFAFNTSGYYGNHYGYGGYCCCYNNTGYGYTPIRPTYYGNNGYSYTPVKPQYTAPRGGGTTGYGSGNYSNTNNNSKSGGGLGRIFNGSSSSNSNNSNSNSNSSSSTPVRTYEPSSSSSSSNSTPSSSSSSSGGGTVTRPARNGN